MFLNKVPHPLSQVRDLSIRAGIKRQFCKKTANRTSLLSSEIKGFLMHSVLIVTFNNRLQGSDFDFK